MKQTKLLIANLVFISFFYSGVGNANDNGRSLLAARLGDDTVNLAATLSDIMKAGDGCREQTNKAEIVGLLFRAYKAQGLGYPGAPPTPGQNAYLQKVNSNLSILAELNDDFSYRLFLNQIDVLSRQLDLSKIASLLVGTTFYSAGSTQFTTAKFVDEQTVLVKLYDAKTHLDVTVPAVWGLSLQTDPKLPFKVPTLTIETPTQREQLVLTRIRDNVVFTGQLINGSYGLRYMQGEPVGCLF